jgi:hypothetical protein
VEKGVFQGDFPSQIRFHDPAGNIVPATGIGTFAEQELVNELADFSYVFPKLLQGKTQLETGLFKHHSTVVNHKHSGLLKIILHPSNY